MSRSTKLKLDDATQANVDTWLKGNFDAGTKEEIEHLAKESPEGLINSFYQRLAFGTAGLRGVMGVGSNRMNVYTVRGATAGLANYLLKQFDSPKVLVGYDSRHHSHRFAEEAARVLAAKGIEVLLFEAIRPVPLVSFGVRHLGCQAGVMITASHNPPEYNGYKVYWSHGGQVLPPHDKGIIEEVEKIADLSQIETAPADSRLIRYVGEEIDQAYLEAVQEVQCLPEQNQTHGAELSVVYTSLHGTGVTVVPRLLDVWGFSNVEKVERQCLPDGDFPTAASPNPEEEGAMALGTAQLIESGSDLLVGTDPDADRMGVAVLHEGEAVLLNGNQIACLCLDHIARHRRVEKGACVKTIVTTELFAAIADHYGLECSNVLTGFKYIGELMEEWSESGEHSYVFGAEESYGYLAGTHARDKDAVVLSGVICELALDAKLQGQTLIDRLEELYQRHGTYREGLSTQLYRGKAGAEEMAKIMERLRMAPPPSLGGVTVERVNDYLVGVGELPKANVLTFWLADGSRMIVRPSGTEPKIKLYGAVIESGVGSVEAADARLAALLEELKSYL